jgi:hypothetical protein
MQVSNAAATQLDSPADDSFAWKWNGDGRLSARSAYRMLFHGSTGLPGAHLIWHSFAPLKYKLHAWLVLRGRCWTADRRLRRGLTSHVICPLCDLYDETIGHLSLHCPFAQGVWSGLISRLGLPDITPGGDLSITDWWLQATARFARGDRKKANSVIMLILRSLWLERNSRVFERKPTAMAPTVDLIAAEWQLWLDSRGRPARGLG